MSSITFMGKNFKKYQCRMLYSLWREVNETCFLLTKLHVKNPPSLTKTLIEEFTARCTCPGYEQPSLFLLLLCQWHLLLPLMPCALVCVPVLHFVLLLNWVLRWSKAGGDDFPAWGWSLLRGWRKLWGGQNPTASRQAHGLNVGVLDLERVSHLNVWGRRCLGFEPQPGDLWVVAAQCVFTCLFPVVQE